MSSLIRVCAAALRDLRNCCSFETRLSHSILSRWNRSCCLRKICQRADHAFPSVEALRRLALATEIFGRIKLRLDRRHDPLGDLVLHREDIWKLAVIAF